MRSPAAHCRRKRVPASGTKATYLAPVGSVGNWLVRDLYWGEVVSLGTWNTVTLSVGLFGPMAPTAANAVRRNRWLAFSVNERSGSDPAIRHSGPVRKSAFWTNWLVRSWPRLLENCWTRVPVAAAVWG